MQYSRLSTQKVNRILLCFCEDITATAAAKLVRVNRKTVNNYYNAIREKILAESLKEMSVGQRGSSRLTSPASGQGGCAASAGAGPPGKRRLSGFSSVAARCS